MSATPLRKRLRRLGRRIGINAATALGIDAQTRAAERRDVRVHGAQIVRVLFFHDSPVADTQRFRDQLSWLRDQFNVIDFPTFTRLCEGSTVLQDGRPAALLTFDDGMVSNYEMAAPILEDAGMRGLFFVVPHFSMRSGADARAFYVERIRNRPPGLTAMTPAQIRELADRGHTIGNHTLTHARLSISPEAEYEAEILSSADIIESWIGRKVEAFSWPLLWNAIRPRAYRMIVERHPYCFTPCSGRMDLRVDSPALVWRTSVETSYDLAEFRFKCSRLADHISARRRRRLVQLLGASLGDAVSRSARRAA
jgi:peptidoglycan/xylan/chitin deacetylase (PgdA/CDA1 family)